MNPPRIAIVADWLTVMGGAEQVIKTLCQTFPEAEIFTTVFCEEAFPFLKGRKVHTTWLQKLPNFLRKRHQLLFFSLPKAIETLDLSDFDLVISSSSFVGKGVITKPEAVHICYCHTPTRYLWDEWQKYIREEANIPNFFRPFTRFLPPFLTKIRMWDFCAAQRPDMIIANSESIAEKIQKFYQREAGVLRPPVDFKRFSKGVSVQKEAYFSAMGRLIPYKKFDLLVETFSGSPSRILKIAGTGIETERLQEMAKPFPNIHFVGYLPDEEVPEFLGKSKAFLFPQAEDAGISPMEAMATGTPIIAFRKGGAIGLVEEGKTGIFFDRQTKESLTSAIEQFEKQEHSFERMVISNSMSKFSEEHFQEVFLTICKKHCPLYQS
jgi:glycosyltransferase involved in cell wall biosynthesis